MNLSKLQTLISFTKEELGKINGDEELFEIALKDKLFGAKVDILSYFRHHNRKKA